MADEYAFPDHLLEAQRDFYILDRRIAELIAKEPRPTLVAAGEAVIPEGQRKALADARAEQLAAVDALYDFSDPFWASVEDRRAAKTALEKAAKTELAGQCIGPGMSTAD